MGQHIHFKDGKYNVWSTVTDSYIFDEWLEEEEFAREYLANRIYWKIIEEVKSIKEGMVESKNGGCSLPYPTYKCKVI